MRMCVQLNVFPCQKSITFQTENDINKKKDLDSKAILLSVLHEIFLIACCVNKKKNKKKTREEMSMHKM